MPRHRIPLAIKLTPNARRALSAVLLIGVAAITLQHAISINKRRWVKAMHKMALVEQTLARAAEVLGDVTPAAIERFYGRFPEARLALNRILPAIAHSSRAKWSRERSTV